MVKWSNSQQKFSFNSFMLLNLFSITLELITRFYKFASKIRKK